VAIKSDPVGSDVTREDFDATFGVTGIAVDDEKVAIEVTLERTGAVQSGGKDAPINGVLRFYGAATVGNNYRDYNGASKMGLVSFASGAQITVNLAGRTGLKELAESESPYLATWTAASGAAGATFTLDADTAKKFKLSVESSTGLRLLKRKGLTVIVR